MALSRTSERRLLSWLHDVQSEIDSGGDPTDSIVKVASANKISRDMVSLLVHSHNIGRQTHQRLKCSAANQPILDRLQDFPVVRLEAVMTGLYPDPQEKDAGVAEFYSQPPREEWLRSTKTASTELPADLVQRILDARASWAKNREVKLAEVSARTAGRDGYDRLAKKQEEMAEWQSKKTAAYEDFLLSIGKTRGYMQLPEHSRVPWDEVVWNSRAMFGKTANSVLEYVAKRERLPLESDGRMPKTARATTPDTEPYCYIRDTLKFANTMLDCEQHRKKVAEALAIPFVEAPRPPLSVLHTGPETTFKPASQLETTNKAAAFPGNILGGLSLGSPAASSGADATAPTPPDITPVLQKLDDPKHQDELQQIRAEATMADLRANDDVIQGYDDLDVANAYNELVQANPAIASQPAVLRAWMRQMLTQGNLSTFELKELMQQGAVKRT